jgi:hypothetical protein
MLNKRNEPIPEDAISLTNAFQRFIQVRFPNLCDLENDAEVALLGAPPFKLVKISDGVSQWQFPEPAPIPEINKYDAESHQAELHFRKWLTEDGPPAYAEDPKNREWKQISRSEWLPH